MQINGSELADLLARERHLKRQGYEDQTSLPEADRETRALLWFAWRTA